MYTPQKMTLRSSRIIHISIVNAYSIGIIRDFGAISSDLFPPISQLSSNVCLLNVRNVTRIIAWIIPRRDREYIRVSVVQRLAGNQQLLIHSRQLHQYTIIVHDHAIAIRSQHRRSLYGYAPTRINCSRVHSAGRETYARAYMYMYVHIHVHARTHRHIAHRIRETEDRLRMDRGWPGSNSMQ